MARIEFHFNAPALLPYTCRLLRKVHGRGLRAQVVGEPVMLAQLDQMLWTFSTLDFIAHCPEQAPADVRRWSRVLLCEQPRTDWDRQVLINLAEKALTGFEEFERVIEVVSMDELHRAQARERWRHYSRAGHELVRHDLAGAPGT